MSTAIVTDSTADLPAHLLDQFPIFQIPAILVMKGRSFRDGEQLAREDFYRQLPGLKVLPTTAAPSVGDFQNQFDDLLGGKFSRVIALHASSELSGIFNASRLAAEEFGARVQVVDSRQLSWGLGFQVLAAAQAAAHGLSLDAILQIVVDIQVRIRVFAYLDTLDYILRSGRVSWVKARLGSLLGVRPLVQLTDGQVLNKGLSRSRGQGIKKLSQAFRNLGPAASAAVLHTDPEFKDRDRILDVVRNHTEEEPYLVPVTPVIGTHVGPNGLGFAAVVK